jgi:hypothetical protein
VANRGWAEVEDLIPHEGLLHSREVFQRAEQNVSVLLPADVLFEISAQFFCQGKENLIFVIDGVLEERHELLARAIRSQSQRYGGNAVDCIEA